MIEKKEYLSQADESIEENTNKDLNKIENIKNPPNETYIEPNYFKRFIKPNERILFASLILALVIPAPYNVPNLMGGPTPTITTPIVWLGIGIATIWNIFGIIVLVTILPTYFSISLILYSIGNMFYKKIKVNKSKFAGILIILIIFFIISIMIFVNNVLEKNQIERTEKFLLEEEAKYSQDYSLNLRTPYDFHATTESGKDTDPKQEYLSQIQQINTSIISLEYCSLREYEVTKDICYLDVAVLNKNPAYCEKIGEYANIQDEYRITNLKTNCYYSISILTEDESYCDKLDSYNKYMCELNFFNKTNSDCYELNNQSSKELCYATLYHLQNPNEICFNEKNILKKDECYLYLSKFDKSINTCKLINQTKYLEICLNNIGEDGENYLIKEYLRDYLPDITTPAEIYWNYDINEIKEIKYHYLSGDYYRGQDQSILNLTYCNTRKYLFNKNKCYRDLAIKETNYSYCNFIDVNDSSSYLKEDCYFSLTILDENITRCENLNEHNKNDCKSYLISTIKNTNCYEIVQSDLKEQCYEKLFSDPYNYWNYCLKERTTLKGDECFLFLAQNKYNQDICLYINQTSVLENCFRNLYSYTKIHLNIENNKITIFDENNQTIEILERK